MSLRISTRFTSLKRVPKLIYDGFHKDKYRKIYLLYLNHIVIVWIVNFYQFQRQPEQGHFPHQAKKCTPNITFLDNFFACFIILRFSRQRLPINEGYLKFHQAKASYSIFPPSPTRNKQQNYQLQYFKDA